MQKGREYEYRLNTIDSTYLTPFLGRFRLHSPLSHPRFSSSIRLLYAEGKLCGHNAGELGTVWKSSGVIDRVANVPGCKSRLGLSHRRCQQMQRDEDVQDKTHTHRR
jgi:hypothetical protein